MTYTTMWAKSLLLVVASACGLPRLGRGGLGGLRPATRLASGGSVASAPAPAGEEAAVGGASVGGGAALFGPFSRLPGANESGTAHTWSAAETLKRYNCRLEEGLSREEAEARRREFGPNALVGAARKSKWAMLASQFEDRLVQILVAVAVVSGVLGLADADDPTAWVDPVVICLILLSNAAVGVWQESSADGALDALKKLQPDRCCCRRSGAWDGEVPAGDLVPGDVVYLRVGDKAPAGAGRNEATPLSLEFTIDRLGPSSVPHPPL